MLLIQIGEAVVDEAMSCLICSNSFDYVEEGRVGSHTPVVLHVSDTDDATRIEYLLRRS